MAKMVGIFYILTPLLRGVASGRGVFDRKKNTPLNPLSRGDYVDSVGGRCPHLSSFPEIIAWNFNNGKNGGDVLHINSPLKRGGLWPGCVSVGGRCGHRPGTFGRRSRRSPFGTLRTPCDDVRLGGVIARLDSPQEYPAVVISIEKAAGDITITGLISFPFRLTN